MIEVPTGSLSQETLEAVIDDFILREGTDYGAVEASMETKRRHVQEQLRSGRAKLYFDPETESVTLLPDPARS